MGINAEEHSFLISSDSLESVKSRMIGFMICEDGSFFVNEFPSGHSRTGCFVLIERDGDKIRISQDFCGSFGLFLYQDEHGFLLSNSFFTLAEKIPEKLSLNKDYMHSFLYAREAPLSLSGTLANEILRLTSEISVEITISSKSLSFRKEKTDFFKRKLASKEDFDVLDSWYFKWTRFYRALAENRYPLLADLSGGLDTRIILSMLINARLDLNSCVSMRSHMAVNITKDAEDMRISKIIADSLHFNLNSQSVKIERKGNIVPEEAFALMRQFPMEQTFYCKMSEIRYHTPIFAAKGLGSIIKGSVGLSGRDWSGMEEALSEYDSVSDKLTDKLASLSESERESFKAFSHEQTRRYARDIVSEMQLDDHHTATYFYKKALIEGRDAKKILCSFFYNQFVVSPFMDPLITEFDYNPYGDDRLYLPTLILSRYAPQLLEFEVEHRSFSKHTLERVEKFNNEYPVSLPKFEKLDEKAPAVVFSDECTDDDGTDLFKGLYASKDFSDTLDPLVGKELRMAICDEFPPEMHHKRPYRPFALIALYEFLKLIRK